MRLGIIVEVLYGTDLHARLGLLSLVDGVRTRFLVAEVGSPCRGFDNDTVSGGRFSKSSKVSDSTSLLISFCVVCWGLLAIERAEMRGGFR